MCVSPHFTVEDFRRRFCDDRAVLELLQKALKEVECVMKGMYVSGCVVCEGGFGCWGNHPPPTV